MCVRVCVCILRACVRKGGKRKEERKNEITSNKVHSQVVVVAMVQALKKKGLQSIEIARARSRSRRHMAAGGHETSVRSFLIFRLVSILLFSFIIRSIRQ